MKVAGMKALSLAIVALTGFGMAGAAFGQTCPTADQTKNTLHSPGGGGAWTSQFIANDATLAVTNPGLNGTNCALYVSIGALSNSRVFVQDSSPQNEARYRGRFYVSLANLPTFGGVSNQTAIIFRVNDTTAPGSFTTDELVVRLAGGAIPTVRFFVADANAGSGTVSIPVQLPTGASDVYRIEFDLQLGTAATSTQNGCTTMPAAGNGCFRYWVNKGSDPSGSDTAPTGSYTVNNAGWSGAKTAFLGLTTGTAAYRGAPGNHAGTVIVLDEFDSRRQTFIGQ